MNSEAIFLRGVLTDALYDFMAGALPSPLVVGDGIAPNEGGWSKGQPGEGQFKSYLVLSTLTARAGQRSPVGLDNDSWLADYGVRAVGGSRQQADWAADQSRKTLLGFPKNYGDSDWRVIRVQFTSLGAVNRNDQVDPPIWELVDSVTLWVERA